MDIKKRLLANDNLVQKTINIEDKLYDRIENLSKNVYNKSISRIINECIYELSETENICIYASENELLVKHTMMFSRRALDELARLQNKYKLPFYKLVNIAIKNVIDELEE